MGVRRRKSTEANLDFAFFVALRQFYEENRGRIRTYYKEVTKRFLDHNDPSTAGAYLRTPQFEALEMYVFLKEFVGNEPVHEIFRQWWDKEGRFEGRTAAARAGQQVLFELATADQYREVYERMRSGNRSYANYIFALTMGTGKTVLMATCIFYEFILANKFPKDPQFCHNALVFAPDTTVLEALREIQTMEMRRVVPAEYVNWLSTHIQFHFLDEAGTALSTMDRSMFNVIISNTQKIILRRRNKEQTAVDSLFRSGGTVYAPGSIYAETADLFEVGDEAELMTNQRFQKLQRLDQLGIYIDEAHHAFGNDLARDVGAKADTRTTSLRLTVDELAKSLEGRGTHVVACYNYTGTPYAQDEVLPDVVYSYGLKEAIEKAYLKQVRINGYERVKGGEFVDIAVGDFLKQVGAGRHEGMLPKMAFFASTIEELEKELRPALEAALARRGVAAGRVLVNVGDPKLTSNDDIREFNRLDTPESEKQFILLVGKGKEGWNCRSLFGVALFRRPKSKIFVLQATMRCLRAIGEGQQVGHVYLSQENVEILREELAQNFRLTVEEVVNAGQEKDDYKVRVKEPAVTVKLKRVRYMYRVKEKVLKAGTSLGLEEAALTKERYRLLHETIEGMPHDERSRRWAEDISSVRAQRAFSGLTLVAEVARYLNRPCLEIEEILERTAEGTGAILALVNEFNEFLYDWVIPRLFGELYEVTSYEHKEEEEVLLAKMPADGHYTVRAAADKVVTVAMGGADQGKSFHLDTYCFDSEPERKLFMCLLRDERVRSLYFTGMLTHGQSEFYVQYIDPESHALRSYYPDFLVETVDGQTVMVEVKGDNHIDDGVVLAKQDYARQMAVASAMRYEMIKGSEAGRCQYEVVFGGVGVQGRMAIGRSERGVGDVR